MMTTQNKASKWWYLSPIVFIFPGGIFAFMVLRKEDNRTAKNCLFIGVVLTLMYIGIYIISLMQMFSH